MQPEFNTVYDILAYEDAVSMVGERVVQELIQEWMELEQNRQSSGMTLMEYVHGFAASVMDNIENDLLERKRRIKVRRNGKNQNQAGT